MEAVSIEGLTAGYGHRPVLDDIHLSLLEGTICALLGHNGSGKTTLMRCLNGLLPYMAGKVRVMNQDVSRMERMQLARLVSFVPQNTYTVFSYSCMDMILMGGVSRMKIWVHPGKEEERQARQVCEDMEISHLADCQFNQLSGGQQQLIMLARALYQNTPVMLLDEPSSHLDFCNQHKVMELMRKIVKLRKVTALITLHDPNLALYYCDEVVMMKKGKIIAGGITGKILNDGNLQAAFGENIRIEHTGEGMPVVVPRFLDENRNMKGETGCEMQLL